MAQLNNNQQNNQQTNRSQNQRGINDKNDMRVQSGGNTFGKENQDLDNIQDSEDVETPDNLDIKNTNVESGNKKPSKFSRH